MVSSPDKFMAAAPFTFLVASLIILIFGPGKASVDPCLQEGSGGVGLRATSAVAGLAQN